MKPQPRESVIVRNIQKRLAPYCLVRKRHGTVNAVKGDPDLYGVLRPDHPFWPRRHFELEVKRPGETCTALQVSRLFEWGEAGALAATVYSAEDALRVLRVGPDWSSGAGPPPGTLLKIATKLANGHGYQGKAEVLEGATEHSIPVRLVGGTPLELTIGHTEIVKVLKRVPIKSGKAL